MVKGVVAQKNEEVVEELPQAKPLVDRADTGLAFSNVVTLGLDAVGMVYPEWRSSLQMGRNIASAANLFAAGYAIPWKSTSTVERLTILNPLLWIGGWFYPQIRAIHSLALACGVARNSLPKLVHSLREVTKRPLAATGSALLHILNLATPLYSAYRAYQSIETTPDSSESAEEGDKWDDFDKKKAEFNKKWGNSPQHKTVEEREQYWAEWIQLRADWLGKWHQLDGLIFNEGDFVENHPLNEPNVCGTSRPLSHFEKMRPIDRLMVEQLDPTCFSDGTKALGLRIAPNCKRSLETPRIKEWTCKAIEISRKGKLAALKLSTYSNDPRLPDAELRLDHFAKTLNDACRC